LNKPLHIALLVLLCAEAAWAKSKTVTSRPRPSDDGVVYTNEATKSSTTVGTTRQDSRSRNQTEDRSIVTAKPTELLDAKIKGKLVLRIANFESKEERNDLDGGYFGIWERDPDDTTQFCRMKFVEPGQGYGYTCLQLSYDVDSPNDAYNGFWLLFVDLDVSMYKKLCFWVRGEDNTSFSTQFNLELKNEEETGRTVVEDITAQWQLKEIPFSEFEGLKNKKKLTEMVIVFEDKYVTQLTGTIYIDNIYFSK
jgi:hypothetical protein